MAKYVELGNRLIGYGPYLHRDVILHGFTLQGSRRKLQELLDRMFEEPSRGELKYTAITSKVFVSFAHIGRVSSIPEADHGSISEVDVTFWVLAIEHKLSLSILRWVPVYLFVDSAAAMAAGREVYGFPKQLGQFEIATCAPSMSRFSTTAFVIPQWGDDARGEWKPLLEIEPVEGGAVEDGDSRWDDLESADRRFFEQCIPDAAQDSVPLRTMQFFLKGLKPKVTMAFLKQFPSVGNTTDACYQAIAEASATVEEHRGGGFTPGRFRARVSSYASHPLEEELGLAGGWQDVGRAIWVDYDFLMHLGRVKWSA